MELKEQNSVIIIIEENLVEHEFKLTPDRLLRCIYNLDSYLH